MIGLQTRGHAPGRRVRHCGVGAGGSGGGVYVDLLSGVIFLEGGRRGCGLCGWKEKKKPISLFGLRRGRITFTHPFPLTISSPSICCQHPIPSHLLSLKTLIPEPADPNMNSSLAGCVGQERIGTRTPAPTSRNCRAGTGIRIGSGWGLRRRRWGMGEGGRG